MRTLLFCASFIFLVETGLSDTFWPTPIPLFDWYEKRHGRAETLQEIITATSPTVATVPAHYWEDALRHSVYLTLVRDKIDQLIAKGDYIRPEKTDPQISKEIDDHDLWDKIKNAPFDRLVTEEPSSIENVTVMAKGRLLEQNGRFRFIEDERSKSNCSEALCNVGVKAFWSVKRVRQGDVESSPGKYHYELTFSVITQPFKEERKSYETPVRTFTVQENSEKREKQFLNHNVHTTPRYERSLWVHKNIVPTTPRYFKHRLGSVDRIFSSWFDDDNDERPPKYNFNPFTHTQHSKMSYMSMSSEHQQPKLIPYPYKPQSVKYFRPSSPTPVYSYVTHYPFDIDAYQTTDYRYVTPNKITKTYKPFLPTLPPPLPLTTPPKNATDAITKKAFNIDTLNSTLETLIPFNPKWKPTPVKVNYFPESVRPPIYNVPPSMLLGLEKNTFKPMPPLKLGQNPKIPKANKPLDFKPSPQILDEDLSNSNLFVDTDFRPITIKYERQPDSTTTSQNIENAETKPNSNRGSLRRTTKKTENLVQEYTTVPEIITASSIATEEIEDDPMGFASILNALVKTTPMDSQTEKAEEIITESSILILTTTIPTTSTSQPTTTTEAAKETTTSSTPKPTKRTRPPPKFIKPEKAKKHKRLPITTIAPNKVRKITADLTPQASSITVTTNKPLKEKYSTTQATTQSIITTSTASSTTTSTTPYPTTSTRVTTETHSTTANTQTSTTASTPKSSTTEKYKNKNRFRQSTLMYKGTSVKHDKWSTNANVSDKIRTVLPPGNFPPRRKASNFIWSIKSSTQPSTKKDHDENDYEDQAFIASSVSNTETTLRTPLEKTTIQISSSTDVNTDKDDQLEIIHSAEEGPEPEVEIENDEVKESKETNNSTYNVITPNSIEDSNEVIQETTQEQITNTASASTLKNTKCKKKKKQNNKTTEMNGSLAAMELETDELLNAKSKSATDTNVTPDMLEEIFGSFTFDDKSITTKKTPLTKLDLNEGESENHEFYDKPDSLDDLLHSLENKDHEGEISEELYDDDENERSLSRNDSYEIEDDGETSRDSNNDDYGERPYSLLELMTMD